MTAPKFTLLVAVVLLSVCSSAFAGAGDYFIAGMIAGQPFTLDQSVHPILPCVAGKDKDGYEWECADIQYDKSKPITIIPVKPEFAAVLQGARGFASPKHNEIRLVQNQTTEQMREALTHEVRHFTGRHKDQLFPQQVASEEQKRAAAVDNARACFYRWPNCR